jgi:hypothetical protein
MKIKEMRKKQLEDQMNKYGNNKQLPDDDEEEV